MNNIIFVDGAETRRRISEMTGLTQGIKAICIERKVQPEMLNTICRKGFGSARMIARYQQAGIPIITSREPKPCRLRRQHTRKPSGATSEKKTQPAAEKPRDRIPVQMTFGDIQDMTNFEAFRKLTIRTLENYIEELKKI